MSSRCTWITAKGAQCPFPATSTGETYGPGRWLCEHHVNCRDGRTGDQIVYDEINLRKAKEDESSADPKDHAERLKRLRIRAWQRKIDLGRELYDRGMQIAAEQGVAQPARHQHALAYVVEELGYSGHQMGEGSQ